MKKLQIKTSPEVEEVFENYPEIAKEKMRNLRNLILATASEVAGLTHLEETLKWGEPSYVTKKGSTLRIDWKPRSPEQYAMYFNCNSMLVETFRMVFGDLFQYEGNRAIIFPLNGHLPEAELKHCITACLTYHQVKHLPMLGL